MLARSGAVLALVLLLDQLTKAWVRATIEPGASEDLLLGIDLVHVRNRGVAFGAFSDGGFIVPAITALALVALLAYVITHRSKPLIWLPTGLLLGGALGNVVDRIRLGAVTDFVDVGWWPSFNVADMAITAGVLALLYVLEGPRARAER